MVARDAYPVTSIRSLAHADAGAGTLRPADTGQIPLRELLLPLRRRWRLLLVAALVGLLLAALYVPSMQPRYASQTVLILDRASNDIATIDTPLTRLVVDSETIASEIEILYSRKLGEQVIEAQRLLDTDEYAVPAALSGPLARAHDAVDRFVGASLGGNGTVRDVRAVAPAGSAGELASGTGADGAGGSSPRERALQAGVDRFQRNLRIDRKGISRAVVVTFYSDDAQRAADVVNEIAKQYVAQQLALRSAQEAEATHRLQDQIDALRSRLARSEVKIEDYRQRIGQTSDDGVSVNQRNIAALNAQRVVAQTEYAAAAALYEEAQRLAATPAAFASLPSTDISPALPQLRTSELDAERELRELSLTYGARHPLVLEARERLDGARSGIRAEISESLAVIEGKTAIARSSREALQREIARLETQESSTWPIRADLLALERERTSDAERLDFYSGRLREISQALSVDNLEPFARVISRGTVSDGVQFPSRAAVLAIVPVLATLACMAWLLLARLFERPVDDALPRLPRGASWLSGLPKVGGLRRLPFFGRRPLALDAGFAAALRTTVDNLDIALAGRGRRVVVITGLARGDGATSLAAGIANESARRGRRTVLVDFDLRRPGAGGEPARRGESGTASAVPSGTDGGPSGTGVGAWADAGALPPDAFTLSRDGRLHTLRAGDAGIDTGALLGGTRPARLLERLAGDFELVVVDSPPILDFPDSGLLSLSADLSLVTVTPGSLFGERRASLDRAIGRLRATDERLVGLVLNEADPRMLEDSMAAYVGSDHYYDRVVRPGGTPRPVAGRRDERDARRRRDDRPGLDGLDGPEAADRRTGPDGSLDGTPDDGTGVRSVRRTLHRESWLLRQPFDGFTIRMLTVSERPDDLRSVASPFPDEPLACYRRLGDGGEGDEPCHVMLLGVYRTRDEAERRIDELGDIAALLPLEVQRISTVQRDILRYRHAAEARPRSRRAGELPGGIPATLSPAH